MRYSTIAGLVAVASASPLEARQSMGINDVQILNYALTLEYLESTFYNQSLEKFSEADFAAAGLPNYFYGDLKEIAYDEATHVSFLSGAIKGVGAQPVVACSYDFGYTDVSSFLAVANVLEGVGVSAYLGAAQNISNKAYLTAAGAILTVEARHSAFIRKNQRPNPQSPFPAPFDTPLDFDQVYSLAAQFITGCPAGGPTLPVKAFPPLAVTSTSAPTVGSTVTVKPAQSVSASGAFFITVLGPVKATFTQNGDSYDVVVPTGVFPGQNYLILTSDANSPTDDNTVAGPAVVMVPDNDAGSTYQTACAGQASATGAAGAGSSPTPTMSASGSKATSTAPAVYTGAASHVQAGLLVGAGAFAALLL